MSTERVPFNLNSLIPETCKTKAEAFARCLQHKLLSLKKVDSSPDSSTRLNSEPQERPKENNFLRPTSENILNKKNTRIGNNKRTEDSDEEFFSHSESDTSDLSESKNPKGKPIMVAKQKLTSMSSEDSTVESWGSCQENLPDFEKVDSENEEFNCFVSQIKGSPKLKNLKFQCKKKELRNKSRKKSSKSHSSSAESVDSESRVPRHLEILGSDSIFLHDLEDDEIPHRVLRESSSTSSLERHFSESFEEISSLKTRLKQETDTVLDEKPGRPSFEVKEEKRGLRFAEERVEGEEFSEVFFLEDFPTNKLSGSVKLIGGVIVENQTPNEKPEPIVYADYEDLIINSVKVLQEGVTEDENRCSQVQPLRSADEEMLDDRARLRRCSSLKSWKTPPGTPGAKKIVRFADALGLDLTDVRTFLDEIPRIPSCAYEDLKFEAPPYTEPLLLQAPTPTLIPLFQQPISKPDFLEKVQLQKISLESAVVTDTSVLTVSGSIRVQNLSFHKSVFVRYSLNNWNTFSDLQATYVPHSSDGFTDKFSFSLYGHTLVIGERLEFALRLESCGSQFWDNNGGINYVFDCLPLSTTNAFFSSYDKAQPEPWPDFY